MSTGQRLGGWSLVAAMALGSATMWVLSPLTWVWIASQVQDGSQPGLTPIVVALGGMVATAWVLGGLLHRANHRHALLTGRRLDRREHAPWARSMRDGRREPGGTVLDVVMACSVVVALALVGLWFLAFADSSLVA